MTRAVVFDVGETLIDETRMWEQAADAAGVPRFTLMGVLGGLAARGERHRRAWTLLGVDQAASTWSEEDFYPDARPAIQALRSKGLRVAAVGNTPREANHARWLSACEARGLPSGFEKKPIAVVTGFP